MSSNPFRRVQIGLALLALVVVVGTVGYALLGFSVLEAFYQTVVTVSTVGYGFPHPIGDGVKAFTVVLILLGVGTALYTFTVTLEVLIDGHMRELIRRRRMDRDIDKMTGHVVICGWGRVGREVARYLGNAGQQIVVVDRDAERVAALGHATVVGDVTDDDTLLRAGIERAGTLIAALDTDADNLFVTVSSRSFNAGIHVIARARGESSEAKLLRVGADRVVNPQRLGGDRMAAFVTQPHVVDFVDVVMHDGSLEFRLEELAGGCRLAPGRPDPAIEPGARPDRLPGAGHPAARRELHPQSVAGGRGDLGGRADRRRHHGPAVGPGGLRRRALSRAAPPGAGPRSTPGRPGWTAGVRPSVRRVPARARSGRSPGCVGAWRGGPPGW